MATYTRNYPKSGSKLTIEYPDGLVRIEEATNYISSKETDPNDINKSLFIIPENGSFIFGSVKETSTVTLIYGDHQDDDPSPAESYHNFQGIRKELDLNSHYDSDKVEYINEQCNIIQACEFSYYFLEYNDDVMFDPDNGVSMIFDIKLEIRGIPDYFKSNVDFYYAQGESETDEHRKMYFAHKFYEPGFVGGIVVKDDDGNIIDIKTARVTQVYDNRKDIEFNGKTTKWMNGIYLNRLKLPTVENYYNYPFGNYYPVNYQETLQEDQVLYDGFCHSTYFDNRYWLGTFPDGIDFRGKHVDYIFDELVAISTRSVLSPGGYMYVDKDKDDNLTVKYDRLYDEQTHSWFDCDFDIIAFDNQDDEIPFFDLPRYSSICENFDETHPGHLGYLFTTRNEFAKIAKYLDFYFNKIFGLEFTGYYVEATPNPGENTYLIDPSVGIPLCDYGIAVAPVFKRKPILHVDVRCSRDADSGGVFDRQTSQYFKRINSALENNKYKDLVTKKNTSDAFWNSHTIEELFLMIKLSPCKFKALGIMAHGGKWSDKLKNKYDFNYTLPIDCTVSVMSIIHKQCLYPKLLQDLLKNRLHDEYFFIAIGSCFGGGLVEDYIHNDAWQQIYTMTTPSLDMGTNYVLSICDNANSPGWLEPSSPIKHNNDDVYNYSEYGESYREQANSINALVRECRTKNINLLVDFMKKHYNFMRTTLLDETKLNWTQETYEKSIYNANNLIVEYSRLDDDDDSIIKRSDQVLKYPIVFLFHIFMNYSDITMNDNFWDMRLMSKRNFFMAYYSSMVTIFYSYAKQGFFSDYNTPEIVNRRKIPINEENAEFFNVNDITFWQTLAYTLNLSNKLCQFVDFFYDIYVFLNKVNDNSRKIRDINKVHVDKHFSSIGVLFDDEPIVMVRGDEEFANCKFPMCPDMPKMPSKQDLAERMPIYGVDRG